MKISVVLEALTGSFETDINRAAKTADKRLKDIEKSAIAAGKAIGAGLVVGATGLALFTKKAIDAADEVSKLAQKTGITTEALSALQYAAKLSGVEDLDGSLVKFNKTISEAAEGSKEQVQAFDALGVSVTDADGKLRGTEAILIDVAEAVSQYADDAGKTSLVLKLFGKSGADLIPLLNGGRDGIEELRKEAAALGLIIRTDTAKQAEELNDNLSRMEEKVRGAGNAIARDLLPVLVPLSNNLADITKNAVIDDAILIAAEKTAIAIATVGESVYGLIKLAGAVGNSFEVVFADIEAAGKLVIAAGTFDNQGITDALAERERVVSAANKRYVDLINYSGTAVSDAIRSAFQKEKAARAGLEPFDPIKDLVGGSGPLIFRPGIGAPADDVVIPFRPGKQNDKPSLAATEPPKPPAPEISKFTTDAISEAQRLIASMQEQLALSGALSEAEKVRISLANGYYGNVAPQEAAQMQRLAESLDLRDSQAVAAQTAADAELSANQQLEGVQDYLRTAEEAVRDSYAARGDIIEDAVNRAVITRTRGDELLAKLDAKELEDLKKLADEHARTSDEVSEYWESAAQGIQGALADFLFDPFDKGLKGMLQSFAQTLQRIAAQAAAANLAELIFGKNNKGGGLLDQGIAAISGIFNGSPSDSGLLAQIGSSFFGGAFADGGNPPIGKASLVGERGPELIVPRSQMTVVPMQVGSGRGGMTVTQNITVQASNGQVSRQSLQQVGAEAARGLARANARNN